MVNLKILNRTTNLAPVTEPPQDERTIQRVALANREIWSDPSITVSFWGLRKYPINSCLRTFVAF
jgi:hypothetical protein